MVATGRPAVRHETWRASEAQRGQALDAALWRAQRDRTRNAHMLRHSAATEMLANGAPPIGVQRVLGHRSLRTTLETYAHACDTHAFEAMAHRFG